VLALAPRLPQAEMRACLRACLCACAYVVPLLLPDWSCGRAGHEAGAQGLQHHCVSAEPHLPPLPLPLHCAACGLNKPGLVHVIVIVVFEGKSPPSQLHDAHRSEEKRSSIYKGPQRSVYSCGSSLCA